MMPTVEKQPSLFRGTGRAMATVKVIGIGGAGCKAASEIRNRELHGVGVVCVDTDGLALDRSHADTQVLLGAAKMRGFGSGGDIDAAREAATEQVERIGEIVAGTTCVVIVAGLGGATGSGAMTVLADGLRKPGRMIIGVPIAPLDCEPLQTQLSAADSLDSMRASCDAVMDLPDPSDSAQHRGGTSIAEIFEAERRSIADFVTTLATMVARSESWDTGAGDLAALLGDGTRAVSGTATGFGHTGAAEAARAGLDDALSGFEADPPVSGAIVLIESGPEVTLSEIATVTSLVEGRIGTGATLRVAVRRSLLLRGTIRVSALCRLEEATRSPLITREPAPSPTLAREPVAQKPVAA